MAGIKALHFHQAFLLVDNSHMNAICLLTSSADNSFLANLEPRKVNDTDSWKFLICTLIELGV